MKMPRSNRMRRPSEFQQVRRRGRSVGGRFMVLACFRDREMGDLRFGFVTSRRVGGAVQRNRIRRRFRAIAREVGERLEPGYQIVTIARRGAADASFDQLRTEWQSLARRLGLLAGNTGRGTMRPAAS